VEVDFNKILDATDENYANLNIHMMGKFHRTLAKLELKEMYLNDRNRHDDTQTHESLPGVHKITMVDWEAVYPSSLISRQCVHLPLIIVCCS
jgi:hypothetical protein